MRRIIAWCVEGLPFDPRSRRAIDETLADWTHEQHAAPNQSRRTLAGVRGLLSIARVVSLALVRETADLGWGRGLARRLRYTAAVVILLAFATVLPMFDGLGALTLPMGLLGVPLTLLAVMPPAIFLMFAWRPVSRAVPTAGAACVLALATLGLAGWLVPLSSESLNELLRQSLGASLALDSETQAHLSFAEAALAVTGWAVLAGASGICATMVGQRAPLMNRWWLVGVPAVYAAVIALSTFAIGSSFLVFRAEGDAPEGFGPGIAAWTTAALLMVLALTYRRRTAAAGSPSH